MKTEWENMFSEANKLFSSKKMEFEIGLDEHKFDSPQKILDWAEGVTREIQTASSVFDGMQVVLKVGDMIAKVENSDGMFVQIIKLGESLGVKSKIQTDSLRYKASIVMGSYLEQKGLVKSNTLCV